MLKSDVSGWNGAYFTLKEHDAAGNTGNTITEGTLENGFQSTTNVCLAPKCYTMTVAGGSWNNEITWEVGSADEGVVATSGAPTECDFSVGTGGPFCANTCVPVGDDDLTSYYYYYYDWLGDDNPVTCTDDETMYTMAIIRPIGVTGTRSP